MTTICTTPTDLAALAARVLSLETSRTADQAAFKALLAEVIADEAKIAALTPPPIIVPPVVIPPYDPQVLWRATMASGTLLKSETPPGDWDDQTISDSALSSAVLASSEGIPPKSGLWVMKQAVTGAKGGTRMARFPEIAALAAAGTTFYLSWWDYYPARITFGPSDMYGIWQLASKDANGAPQPIWALLLNGADGTLGLGWSPSAGGPAEGPHVGEFASRVVYPSALPVPIGAWTFFEIRIKPAADFTGALKVWMNGQVLFDMFSVKVRFPDSALGGFTYVTHLAYGSGLTPTPAVHFVDDVTVSLGRMP